MVKTPDIKGAKADGSFSTFYPGKGEVDLNGGTQFPEDQTKIVLDGPGQKAWSSLKQRQKGDSPQKTYTADEVEAIVKNAVAEAWKAFSKPEKKEKKEPAEEIKIGGR